MSKYSNTCGLFLWEEKRDGHQFVHPEDLEKVIELFPFGKIFVCVAESEDFITLKYGDINFRAKPEKYQILPINLTFRIGSWVHLKNNMSKKGAIYEIKWHLKNQKPIFMIRVNGTRKSTNWYGEDELEKIDE
jgi:hypothetical protein